jgi:hypothetical protein
LAGVGSGAGMARDPCRMCGSGRGRRVRAVPVVVPRRARLAVGVHRPHGGLVAVVEEECADELTVAGGGVERGALDATGLLEGGDLAEPGIVVARALGPRTRVEHPGDDVGGRARLREEAGAGAGGDAEESGVRVVWSSYRASWFTARTPPRHARSTPRGAVLTRGSGAGRRKHRASRRGKEGRHGKEGTSRWAAAAP